jgi:transcription elongation factor GreA
MAKQTLITKEGYEKLKAELEYLMTVERPRISQQIAEAREKGDISENAEYDAAREAQAMLELKINKLKELIGNCKIIDESKLENDKVRILSKVTLLNLKTKAKVTYTLVPDNEADLKNNKLSINSPLAQAILGKKKGETVEVKVPAGLMKFKIENIE